MALCSDRNKGLTLSGQEAQVFVPVSNSVALLASTGQMKRKCEQKRIPRVRKHTHTHTHKHEHTLCSFKCIPCVFQQCVTKIPLITILAARLEINQHFKSKSTNVITVYNTIIFDCPY